MGSLARYSVLKEICQITAINRQCRYRKAQTGRVDVCSWASAANAVCRCAAGERALFTSNAVRDGAPGCAGKR